MDFGQSFQNMFNSIIAAVPRIITFLVVLLIGWIVAKALYKVVDMILERVGFDRLVERGSIGETLRRKDYDASDIIAKIVYYAVLLIALQLAFSAFGPNPVSTLLASVVAWLPALVVAIVLVVVATAIANVVKEVIGTALGGRSYGPVLANIAAGFIIALGVIAALEQIGIATAITTPVLIAVLATAGAILAIGVGGGMIRPMQTRWDRWLNAAEEEAREVRGPAYQRGREDATRGGAVPTEEPAGATQHDEAPPRGRRS